MKKLVLLAGLLSIPLGWGANHYVRQGASGNGSDWSNALSTLPSNLVRGDIYYIADGTYPGFTLAGAISGTQYITIKKATGAEHGTDAGWQAAYGDGQAVFTGAVVINSSYFKIDGAYGGGPGQWEPAYGFKVEFAGETGPFGYQTVISNLSRYITVSHVDFHNLYNSSACSRILRAYDAGTNITYSYCAFRGSHGGMNLLGAGADNMTFEYCFFDDCSSSSSCHGEFFSSTGTDNLTVRYCLLRDAAGTAFLVAQNGSASGMDDNTVAEKWYIYGNVFMGKDRAVSTIINCNDGSKRQHALGWRIHNNSFVTLKAPSNSNAIALVMLEGNSSDNEAYNNLVYNPQKPVYWGGVATDYNWYSDITALHSNSRNEAHVYYGSNEDPFVSAVTGDFRLKKGTTAGMALTEPFTMDQDSRTRGQDGTWDRGAFEYDPTQVSISDYRLPNADFPALPSPIYNVESAISNGKLYNILGQPVKQYERTGIYLVPDGSQVWAITLVKQPTT